MTQEYENKYLINIKNADSDDEIKSLINQIYEDGFEDGNNEVPGSDQENPRYWTKDLEIQNAIDMQDWADNQEVQCLVDEEKGGIIGYIHQMHTKETIEKLNKGSDQIKELLNHMDWLMSVAESYYPEYSSCDRIAEINDKFKEYDSLNWKEKPYMESIVECRQCQKNFSTAEEGSSDDPDLCDDCWAENHGDE